MIRDIPIKNIIGAKIPLNCVTKLLEFMRLSPNFHPKLLDLGCGEGRNAIYFAKHGFEVFGLDASQPGLQKTRRYAEKVGVHGNHSC